MKLFIPKVNDKLKLLEDWKFILINEIRNEHLWVGGKKNLKIKDEEYSYGYDGFVYLEKFEWRKFVHYRSKEYFKNSEYEDNDNYKNVSYDYNLSKGECYWNVGVKITGEEKYKIYKKYPDKNFILPKDTILRVDRVYIRKDTGWGSDKYNSLSFVIEDCPNKNYNKSRFFARLDDCNNMEIEIVK